MISLRRGMLLCSALVVLGSFTTLVGCKDNSAEETKEKYSKGAKDPAGEDEKATK